MKTDSRRMFLTRALVLGGAVACGTNVRADLPKQLPPTLEWLVRYSPIIAVCEVQRIGFVFDQVKGGPATYTETKPATWADMRVVMELRVVEWLRPPRRHAERPLRVFGFSSYDVPEYRERYVGQRLLFFLQPARAEDRRPNDPEDYFTGVLSTAMHGVTRPEPVAQVPEVRRLLEVFPDARPYGQ